MSWLVLGLGLVLAAFGAMSGAALVTVSRAELAQAVSRRLRGDDASLAGLAEVEAQLTVASVTTSLGVLLLGAAVPAFFAGLGALRSLAVVLVAGLPLALLGGYFLPRWLTLPRADAVARAVRPVLEPWTRFVGLLLPVRRGAVRPGDLRALWREGAAVPGVGTHEDELLLAGGVLGFSQKPVREIMTPRTDLVAVAEDAPREDIVATFAQSGYSRLPVYRGTLDEIVGMLHAFDLFRAMEGQPLPVRPVTFTPASRACGDLLLDMQRERRHLAVVLDEFGGTLGIATLEDLLEQLVGDIFDEHDEGTGQFAVAEAALVEADGSTTVGAIEERFGVALPRGESATLGGRLAELAGRIPAAGERFVLAGLEVDVLAASPARVERLVVRAQPPAAVVLGERAP